VRRPGVLLVVCAVIAVTGAPSEARAQVTDAAAAAELFRQGREALEAKDYPLACAKLLDSLRLDVRVGTLFSLGECEDALGKVASARLRMQQAGQLARRIGDPRAAACDARFATLDARVPRLLLHIAPGAPPATFVRKDSVDVGPTALGVPLPVEVGPHLVVGLAPHHDTRSYAVDAVEGKLVELAIEPGPLLPDLPIAPEDLPPADRPAAPPPPPPSRSNPVRTSAYVAGALGLATVGFGAYFGIQAIHEASGAPGHCSGNVCDAQGAAVRHDAVEAGNASTVVFAAGGVLLAGAVVLYVLSPGSEPQTTVRVAPVAGGANVGVARAW